MFRRLVSDLDGFCENLHGLSRKRWNLNRRRELSLQPSLAGISPGQLTSDELPWGATLLQSRS